MNHFLSRSLLEHLIFIVFIMMLFILILARFTLFKKTDKRSLIGRFFMIQLLR